MTESQWLRATDAASLLWLIRERRQTRSREIAVVILDEMQMLDQEIAPARPITKQRAHFIKRLEIDLPALGRASRPSAAAAPVGVV